MTEPQIAGLINFAWETATLPGLAMLPALAMLGPDD